MRKTKHTIKEQYLRGLFKELRTLDTNGMDWEPVEEPEFIGWDVTVKLNESRQRSRDAEDLNTVLQVLGCNKPYFVRSQWVVSAIRNSKRSYPGFLKDYEKIMNRKYGPYDNGIYWSRNYVPNLYAANVHESVYIALPAHLRKFFVKNTDGLWWHRANADTYRLSYGVFPMYALTLKVERAYSTHRGIPHSKELRREAEIDTILEREHYYPKYRYNRWRGNRFWRRQTRIVNRHLYSTAFTEVCNWVGGIDLELVNDKVYEKAKKEKKDLLCYHD